MKIRVVFLKSRLRIAIIFLAINPLCVFAQFYYINFEGSGAASHVDSVRVHNITQETMLVMDGSDTLFLYGTVGMPELEKLNTDGLLLYPNPAKGFATAVFGVGKHGTYSFNIFDASGRLITTTSHVLLPGSHTYQIHGLGKGVYIVFLESEHAAYAAKLISTAKTEGPVLLKRIKSQIDPARKAQKSSREIVQMQYNHGDLLLLTCYADIYAVVIPLVATESTTITADFRPCTDGDGNHYPIVYIGSQIWMASNLRTTKYNDGSDIPQVTSGSSWVNLTIGAYCWYNNSIAYMDSYGALYNWYAINPETNGNKELCPEGWSVPTDAQYTILTTFLGGSTVAGGKLKETGFTHWNSPNTGASNETGFSARAGGHRTWDGSFARIGRNCYLWTATEQQGNFAWLRNMFHYASNICRGSINKIQGFSLRCIKD